MMQGMCVCACACVQGNKRLGAAVETDSTVDLDQALGVHTRLEVQTVHVLCDEAHVRVHPVCA